MNKIKKSIISAVVIAFAVFGMFACADNNFEPENEVSYFETFDAWVKKNYPHLKKVEGKDGFYMLIHKNSPEGAPKVTDSCYVNIEYSSQMPNGSYLANTDPALALKLNTFSFFTNYVPFKFRLVYWANYYGLTAAQYEALKQMSRDDEVEIVAAPNYAYYYALESSSMYEGFRGNGSTANGSIAHIKMKLTDFVLDGKREAERNVDNYAEKHDMDYVEEGLYMKWTTKSDIEADSVRKDTTLTLRYTGYFINNFVFDTNIKEVAEERNIYNSDNKYEPLSFRYNEYDSSEYGGMIKAYKPIIKKMRLGDKITFICYPSLAYGANGKYGGTSSGVNSGTLIYTETPLLFNLEIIKKEEED